MNVWDVIGVVVGSLVGCILLLILLLLACLKCHLRRRAPNMQDTDARIGLFSKLSYVLKEPVPNLTKKKFLWFPYSQSHNNNDDDSKQEMNILNSSTNNNNKDNSNFQGFNLDQTLDILSGNNSDDIKIATKATLIVVFSGGAQRIGGFQRYELRRTLSSLQESMDKECHFDELYLMDPTGLSWYCYNYDTAKHDGWNDLCYKLLKLISQCKYKNIIFIGFCMGSTSAMIILHKMIEKLINDNSNSINNNTNNNNDCNFHKFILLSFNPQTDPLNHLNGKYKYGCKLLPKEIQESFLNNVNQCCIYCSPSINVGNYNYNTKNNGLKNEEKKSQYIQFYQNNVQLWIHFSDMESELNDALKLSIESNLISKVKCPIDWNGINGDYKTDSDDNDDDDDATQFNGGVKKLIIHKDCNFHALLRFLRDAGELQKLLKLRLKSFGLASDATTQIDVKRNGNIENFENDKKDNYNKSNTKVSNNIGVTEADRYYQLSADE